MKKDEIKQAINTLIMVTGDCPYERGFGEEKDFKCDSDNCVDCWKIALSKELKRLEINDTTI
jgi:hypothetical protein